MKVKISFLESLLKSAKAKFELALSKGEYPIGVAKISICDRWVACSVSIASGSVNRRHSRTLWFIDGKRVAFSDLVKK